MLVDIPETDGGKRWGGQRMELQVSMQFWKLWPENIYKKKKEGRGCRTAQKTDVPN